MLLARRKQIFRRVPCDNACRVWPGP